MNMTDKSYNESVSKVKSPQGTTKRAAKSRQDTVRVIRVKNSSGKTERTSKVTHHNTNLLMQSVQILSPWPLFLVQTKCPLYR